MNAICGKNLRSILPAWLPNSTHQLSKRLQKTLRNCIESIMATQSKEDFNSLLNLLNASNDSMICHDKKQLIFDQITTFLFAGFETTAASLSFTFYLLSLHPDVQKRIKQEAEQVLHFNEMPTLEAMKQLKFTTAVYRESLRLYPPAWILAREVSSPDVINGYQLKKGDTVIISVRSIHRHPLIWDKPNQFCPERFYENNEWPGKVSKFAFIPFGAGSRLCSGASLAMLEAIYVIAKLVSQFQFELLPDTQLTTTAMITLHPKEMISLKVRKHECT